MRILLLAAMVAGAYADCAADDEDPAGVVWPQTAEGAATPIPRNENGQTCDAYTRNCLAGDNWEAAAGGACVDVNECDANPCATGATCANGNASGDAPVCTCPNGQTAGDVNSDADTCADVNECDANPCATGATCANGNASGDAPVCTCPQGQTAGDVNSDADTCANAVTDANCVGDATWGDANHGDESTPKNCGAGTQTGAVGAENTETSTCTNGNFAKTGASSNCANCVATEGFDVATLNLKDNVTWKCTKADDAEVATSECATGFHDTTADNATGIAVECVADACTCPDGVAATGVDCVAGPNKDWVACSGCNDAVQAWEAAVGTDPEAQGYVAEKVARTGSTWVPEVAAACKASTGTDHAACEAQDADAVECAKITDDGVGGACSHTAWAAGYCDLWECKCTTGHADYVAITDEATGAGSTMAAIKDACTADDADVCVENWYLCSAVDCAAADKDDKSDAPASSKTIVTEAECCQDKAEDPTAKPTEPVVDDKKKMECVCSTDDVNEECKKDLEETACKAAGGEMKEVKAADDTTEASAAALSAVVGLISLLL